MTPDDPSLTAAGDQADAAAADVAGRVRAGYELAEALGITDWSYSAAASGAERRGPRARVIAEVQARLEGEVEMCEHVAAAFGAAAVPPGLARSPARAPEAVVWVSWHPGLVSCPQCSAMLPAPDAAEDRRCDGCGRVLEPGEPMLTGSDVIRANPAAGLGGRRLAPPLICAYGLCQRCAAESGLR